MIWIVGHQPGGVDARLGRGSRGAGPAELVVVQDAHHPTETSALAHAVLPAAAWPEKEGTMTNSERRVGLVGKLIEPPGDALPDWRIFARLAAALGHADAFAWPDVGGGLRRLRGVDAGRPCDVSGLSHERLSGSGSVQWPCPAKPDHDGTAASTPTAASRRPTAGPGSPPTPSTRCRSRRRPTTTR